jgi:hypothetical protein
MDLVTKPPTSIFTILITIVIVLVSLTILYFLYKFVGGSSSITSAQIIKAQVPANIAHPSLPNISGLYEGGDYAVSVWVYINSYNINRNTLKHVLEIGGANFSTLLIALGAFKNTLSVRTHSRDSESVVVGGGPANTPIPSTSNVSSEPLPTLTKPASKPPGTVTSFYDASGVLRYFNRDGKRLDSTGKVIESFQNATPGSSDATRQDGSLTARDLDAMFKPLAMDDSLLNPTQICDIPVIDMQRWVNITVALSGRTIDVYMDGKLARSCLTPSYYKVDPTGVKLKITERGGFDGYINGVNMYNYPLSPADVYHIYQAGPTGTSAGVGTLVNSLFTGGK